MLNKILISVLLLVPVCLRGQEKPPFNVIAFYTGKADKAHISFVKEANGWFRRMAEEHSFRIDFTNNWNNMNDQFLEPYNVVIFLDTRPDSLPQREAFRRFIERGGGWMGFHFSAFALTPSAYPQNWDWYHEEFLGSGSYVSNTWRPTAAILRVEVADHPAVAGLPPKFKTSPNEWYRWSNDLRKNPSIQILLSIDSTSFPLGTGPKPYEIWHSGDYPVVWSNTKYNMIYLNMGHNDIDYEHHTDKELSKTFGNPYEDRLIINSLLWLGGR